MNLSPNFTLEEFTRSDLAEKFGLDNTPDKYIVAKLKSLAANMELVRSALGNKPIIVMGGYRAPTINRKQDGYNCPDHINGYACDFICPEYGDPYEVAKALALSEIDYDRVIYEKFDGAYPHHWVHVSFNPLRRNERYTNDGRGMRLGIRRIP